jgi:FdhD protein
MMIDDMPTTTRHVLAQVQQGQQVDQISLRVAEEVPVALIYNGISHVVLMATPQHLRELAYGFSLSEGIIEHVHQIYHVDIDVQPTGILVQIELSTACFDKLKLRRRQMTGRTGCGLCGIEALGQIAHHVPSVHEQLDLSAIMLQQGFATVLHQQYINQQTGGCHAAALLLRDGHVQVFEDVGRHNAFDKLIGWRLLHQQPMGAVLLTSRLSYELIQKAAYAGLPLLAAISAPTGLAVRLAQQAGIRLAVFVREGRVTWLE